MPRSKRFALLSAFAAMIAVCAWVGMSTAGGRAVPVLGMMTAPPAQALPEQVRLATCDVYGLVERLIGTADYYVPRKQEEEQLKSELQPLEARLTTIKNSLQGADPSKPENIAIQHDYQVKYAEYVQRRKDAQDSFAKLVAGQYTDAYEKVQAVATRIAHEDGYTHIANQRAGKMKPTGDAQKIAEEFLARPYLVTPPGTDLTEKVRLALNLPEEAQLDPTLLGKPDDDKKKSEGK